MNEHRMMAVRVGRAAVVFAAAIPVLILVLQATAARWSYPHVLPEQWSLRGLQYLVEGRDGLLRALGGSVTYSLAVVACAAVVSVLPASVLGRYEFRGRILLEALFLSPVLVPAITYGMGIHFLFIRIGLADTAIGVVVVLTAASYPYMLRALIAGFRQIHPDFDVCAANLGASGVFRLFRVHLPLLGPAFVAGGSVVFLVAFSEYFLVFLIGGGIVPSFTAYLFPFLTGGDRTIAAALTLLFLVVPLLLFILTDRLVTAYYRRRGMTGQSEF